MGRVRLKRDGVRYCFLVMDVRVAESVMVAGREVSVYGHILFKLPLFLFSLADFVVVLSPLLIRPRDNVLVLQIGEESVGMLDRVFEMSRGGDDAKLEMIRMHPLHKGRNT